MAQAYNFAANFQIQQVLGVRQAVQQVQAGFKNASVDVNIRVSPASLRNLEALNSRIALLRTNLQAVQGSVASLTGGIGAMNSTSRGATANMANLSNAVVVSNTAMRAAREEIRAGTTSLERFGTQAGHAVRRFLAFSVSAGAIIAGFRGLREGIGQALEFEKAMIKVAQVSGETPDKVQAIEQEVSRLSKTLGVSSQELVGVALTLKQAGLSAQETKTALQAVAEASLAPNFGSMKEIVEGSIAVFRQFDGEVGNLSTHLGAMNAVAGAFAVEASDLVEVVRKAGGSFKQTGGDLNQLLGLFTAVRSTTRESAETISTGLRTIFTRLQRNETVEALKSLQINLRYTSDEATRLGNNSLENQFVGAEEAVRRLSEGLKGLQQTDPRYAGVVEELGGYRQISKVIPLLQQFGESQKAINVAQIGQISLQSAAEKAQGGLLNRTKAVKEEFLELFRALTKDSGFQALAKSLLNIAKIMASVLDYLRPMIPLFTSLAAIKIGQALIGAVPRFVQQTATGRAPDPILRRARGGVVPGVGDTDSVPAYLTPGEFVIRKSSAQKIGYSALQDMNSGVQRFAGGGQVQTRPGVVGIITSQKKKVDETFVAPIEKRQAALLSNLIDNVQKPITDKKTLQEARLAGASRSIIASRSSLGSKQETFQRVADSIKYDGPVNLNTASNTKLLQGSSTPERPKYDKINFRGVQYGVVNPATKGEVNAKQFIDTVIEKIVQQTLGTIRDQGGEFAGSRGKVSLLTKDIARGVTTISRRMFPDAPITMTDEEIARQVIEAQGGQLKAIFENVSHPSGARPRFRSLDEKLINAAGPLRPGLAGLVSGSSEGYSRDLSSSVVAAKINRLPFLHGVLYETALAAVRKPNKVAGKQLPGEAIDFDNFRAGQFPKEVQNAFSKPALLRFVDAKLTANKSAIFGSEEGGGLARKVVNHVISYPNDLFRIFDLGQSLSTKKAIESRPNLKPQNTASSQGKPYKKVLAGTDKLESVNPESRSYLADQVKYAIFGGQRLVTTAPDSRGRLRSRDLNSRELTGYILHSLRNKTETLESLQSNPFVTARATPARLATLAHAVKGRAPIRAENVSARKVQSPGYSGRILKNQDILRRRHGIDIDDHVEQRLNRVTNQDGEIPISTGSKAEARESLRVLHEFRQTTRNTDALRFFASSKGGISNPDNGIARMRENVHRSIDNVRDAVRRREGEAAAARYEASARENSDSLLNSFSASLSRRPEDITVYSSVYSRYRNMLGENARKLRELRLGTGDVAARSILDEDDLLDFANPQLLARGGAIKRLPASQRATKAELIKSFRQKSSSEEFGVGQPPSYRSYVKDMLDAALTQKALQRIPKGSEFLGSGLLATAFKTPDGNVIRVQDSEAFDRADKYRKRWYNVGLDESVAKVGRRNVKGVLPSLGQTMAWHGKGWTHLEKTPFAENVSFEQGSGAHQASVSLLSRQLGESGYALQDAHVGNLARYKGNVVVRDPGSVRPMTPEELADIRKKYVVAEEKTVDPRQAFLQRTRLQQKMFGGAVRYADGGSVVTRDNVLKIVREFSDKTGIDFSKLIAQVETPHLVVRKGEVESGDLKRANERLGTLRLADKDATDTRSRLFLSRKNIRTIEDLKFVLAHELGHAADAYLGDGRTMLSKQEGSPNFIAGQAQADIVRNRDRANRLIFPGKEGKYRYSVAEGFANAFAENVLGRTYEGKELSQPEQLAQKDFGKVIKVLAARTRPLRKMATGGSADTVPALLTPGEFVLNRDAASRIGAARLHKMNAHGDVHGYNRGGQVTQRGPLRLNSGSPGPVGEQHPVQNFPTDTFPGIHKALAARAAQLGVAISSVTDIMVQFKDAGPVFVDIAKSGEQLARATRDAATNIKPLRKAKSDTRSDKAASVLNAPEHAGPGVTNVEEYVRKTVSASKNFQALQQADPKAAEAAIRRAINTTAEKYKPSSESYAPSAAQLSQSIITAANKQIYTFSKQRGVALPESDGTRHGVNDYPLTAQEKAFQNRPEIASGLVKAYQTLGAQGSLDNLAGANNGASLALFGRLRTAAIRTFKHDPASQQTEAEQFEAHAVRNFNLRTLSEVTRKVTDAPTEQKRILSPGSINKPGFDHAAPDTSTSHEEVAKMLRSPDFRQRVESMIKSGGVRDLPVKVQKALIDRGFNFDQGGVAATTPSPAHVPYTFPNAPLGPNRTQFAANRSFAGLLTGNQLETPYLPTHTVPNKSFAINSSAYGQGSPLSSVSIASIVSAIAPKLKSIVVPIDQATSLGTPVAPGDSLAPLPKPSSTTVVLQSAADATAYRQSLGTPVPPLAPPVVAGTTRPVVAVNPPGDPATKSNIRQAKGEPDNIWSLREKTGLGRDKFLAAYKDHPEVQQYLAVRKSSRSVAETTPTPATGPGGGGVVPPQRPPAPPASPPPDGEGGDPDNRFAAFRRSKKARVRSSGRPDFSVLGGYPAGQILERVIGQPVPPRLPESLGEAFPGKIYPKTPTSFSDLASNGVVGFRERPITQLAARGRQTTVVPNGNIPFALPTKQVSPAFVSFARNLVETYKGSGKPGETNPSGLQRGILSAFDKGIVGEDGGRRQLTDRERQLTLRLASNHLDPTQQVTLGRSILETQRESQQRSDESRTRFAKRNLAGDQVIRFKPTSVENPDGSTSTVTSSRYVEGQAQKLYEKAVNYRGGEQGLADSTKAALLTQSRNAAQANFEREFVQVRKTQILAARKGMSSAEAEIQARDDLTKVLRGQASALANNGKVLGETKDVRAYRESGRTPPGASPFFSGIFDRAKTGLGNIASNPGGAIAGGLGRLGTLGAGSNKLFTASFILPQLISTLDSLGGSTEAAAARGESEAFYGVPGGRKTLTSGIGGGLSGLVTGLFAASAISGGAASIGTAAAGAGGTTGAVGAAVAAGAASGPGAIAAGLVVAASALYGFISAVRQADSDLRQARINTSLTAFADRTQQLAQNGVASSSGVVLSAQSELEKYLKENEEKTRKESAGFLGFGQDEVAYGVLKQKNLRQDLGGSLPSMVQALNKQAEELGKTNLTSSVKELSQTLFAGRNGLNESFLKLIADIRKIPIDEVKKDFEKVLEQSQRKEQNDREAVKARQSQSKAVGAAGYIVRSLQEGRDENQFRELNYRTLAGLSGQRSPYSVNLGAERLGQFGRTDRDYLDTLGVLKNIGGEQGSTLYDTGVATARVESLLPGILTEVRNTRGLEEKDYGARARVLLTKALGEDNLKKDQNLAGVVNSALSQLNEVTKNTGQLDKELKVDATGLSSRLVGPQKAILANQAQPAIQLFEAQLNRDLGARTDLEERKSRTGELQDRGVALRVQRLRAEAEINDVNTLSTPGSTLRRTPLSSLQADFRAAQERLTGEQGEKAFDPALIAQKIAANEKDLVRSGQNLQVLGQRAGGATDPDRSLYTKGRDEFLKLETTTRKLNQAMGNLSDATARNATVQERLNLIQKDQQGRLSYAEKFITSSPEQRLELNRSASLLKVASERGSLEGFTTDQQRSIVEAGRSLGSVSLPALGGDTGDTIVNRLIANTPGLKELVAGPKGEKGEVAQLQAQLVSNMKAAEEAVKLSANSQEKNNKTFLDSLDKQFKSFFERQAKSLGGGQVADRQNQKAQLEIKKEDQNRKVADLELLKRVGIKDEAGLKAAVSKKGSFEAIFSVLDTREDNTRRGSELEKVIEGREFGQKLTDTVRGYSLSADSYENARHLRKGFTSTLEGPLSGITPEARGVVVEDALKRVSEIAFNRSRDLTSLPREQRGEAIAGIFQTALSSAAQNYFHGPGEKNASHPLDAKAKDASNLLAGANVDVSALLRLGPDARKAILKALGQDYGKTEGSATPLDNASKALSDVTKELNTLVEKIAELQKRFPATGLATGGPVPYLSGGGFPFQPRGTDTVPAMLTPGEYVVNARSAKANLKLLESINKSQGTAYLAEGGVLIGGVPYSQYASLEEKRKRHQRRVFDAKTEDQLTGIGHPRRQGAGLLRADDEQIQPPRNLTGAQFWKRHAEQLQLNRRGIADRHKERRQEIVDTNARNTGPEVGPPTLEQVQRSVGVDKLAKRLDRQKLFLEKRLEEASLRGYSGEQAESDAQEFYQSRLKAIQARRDQLQDPEQLNKLREALDKRVSLTTAAVQELGGIDSLRRRQSAARGGNSLEYFGLGKADAQSASGGRQQSLSSGQQRFGEHFRREFSPTDPLAYLRFLGIQPQRVPYYADGGKVDGHSSGDSVLGWLTPGEHVVSRKGVDKAGGHGAIQRFANGGVVGGTNYPGIGGTAVELPNGGSGVSPQVLAGMEQMSKLAVSLDGFRDVSTAFTAAMNRFSGVAQELAKALSAFPAKLEVSGKQTVEVIFNGAEVFAKIAPEMKTMVEEKVKEVVNQVFRDHLPDAGVNLE